MLLRNEIYFWKLFFLGLGYSICCRISLCYKTVDYLALLAQNLRRVAYLEFELLPRICSHFRSAHQEQEGRVTPAMRLRIWTNWRKIFCLRIWTNTYRGLMEPQKFTSVIYNNCFSELRTMSKSPLWPSETLCDQWGQCLFGQDHWENETWGLVWSWILIFKPTAKCTSFVSFVVYDLFFQALKLFFFFFHFSLVIPFSVLFF